MIWRAGTWRRPLIGGLAAALVTVASVVLVPASPASAASLTFTAGFNASTFTTAPSALTNFTFLPNSTNMLATTKSGQLSRGSMNGGWATVSWPSEGIVYSQGDRGLLGIDVDPLDSRIVYLLYDYLGSDGFVYGRLSRLTGNSATAPTALSSEIVLLDGLPSYSANVPGSGDDSHTIGTVIVAPDRTLYVGVGDGSSYTQVDPSALNAQDITSPRGKIFHINGDGTPAAGNPFAGNGSYWAQRVFAYGLRNPFRFSLSGGKLYIGDVGWNTWEEVDVAAGGENFGWPCFEGPQSFANGYANRAECTPIRNNPGQITFPLYYWNHDNPEGTGGHAAVGGVIATAPDYGPLTGAYFFADFAYGKMWALPPGGPPRQLFGQCPGDAFGCTPQINPGDAANVVAIRLGPNGHVYYADITTNRISEIKYQPGTNQPPVAQATVDPTASADLSTNFEFDASASFDPDGGPVTVSWSFGDGASAAGKVVTHRYSSHGTFVARATVTDSAGGVGTIDLVVATDHSLPTLTLKPNKTGAYAVGDQVKITATAKDESGTPITGAGITWSPVLHHCPTGVSSGACHLHPQAEGTGTTYSMAVPDHGDDMYLEFRATATDHDGFSTTASFNLPMDEHTIAIQSDPPGVAFDVNAGSGTAPLTATAVTNSLNRVTAPTTANGGVFLRWSDGSTQVDRLFTMPPGDVNLTAIYSTSARFTPVSPYRVFDTRSGAALQPGATLALDLSNQPGAPSDGYAVLLNVTATDPAAAGYVRAFPCGVEPNISTVNFDPGQTAANLAIVRLPADHRVCFTSLVPTDLVIDVGGWYSVGTGTPYTAVDPVRVLDTRTTASLAGGEERRLHLDGGGQVPADASAVLLNLTVTDPADAGYVRAYPCGDEADTSNVNYVAGQTVANLAAVKLAAGGDVCFRTFAPTQLVVDLAGWYGPSATQGLVTADPQRLFDTRATPGFARLTPGAELAVPLAGAVPAGAAAVVLNLTAANPDAAGYVQAYPCGSHPDVSNVNYRALQVAAANLAVVKLPGDGRVCLSSFAATDLVVDLVGWYVA